MNNRDDFGVVVRPATESDQPSITNLVREAHINTMGLNWRRFLVAEVNGRIVGTGQIKPHKDGSRELASIAVVPDLQAKGIASAIISAILAPETETLYLMCQRDLETFYRRFGFRRIHFGEMPPHFWWMSWLIKIITPVLSLFIKGGVHIIIMKRATRPGDVENGGLAQ